MSAAPSTTTQISATIHRAAPATHHTTATLLLLAFVGLAVGCQSLEKGIPGFSGYLQFAFGDDVVFEYAVPSGNMNCERNAAINNKSLEGKTTGRYRCASYPAPQSQLPYSYVSISTLGPAQGFHSSSATTTRYASSEDCQSAVAALSKSDERLIRDNCLYGDEPIRVRKGEKLA
jgi:hypothetical protein